MAHTYFFALFPEPSACQRIHQRAAALQARLGLRGQLVAPAKLHVTLHFIGRFGTAQPVLETRGFKVGDAVSGPMFAAVFDRALSFVHGREKSPCVFAAEDAAGPMHGLAESLHMAMKSPSRLAANADRFRPHVTWLYSADAIAGELAIEPLGWQAREFAFVHGIQGAAGYDIIGRWPLA